MPSLVVSQHADGMPCRLCEVPAINKNSRSKSQGIRGKDERKSGPRAWKGQQHCPLTFIRIYSRTGESENGLLKQRRRLTVADIGEDEIREKRFEICTEHLSHCGQGCWINIL